MIFNEQRKILVWALNRCGSNYVDNQSGRHPKRWKNTWEQDIEHITPDYLVIKVIRDPMDRFTSWFQSFVTSRDFLKNKDYLIQVKRDNLNEWFDKFKIYYHYDTHTCLQSIRYQMYRPLNCNVKYLHSKDLSTFFNAEPYNENKTTDFFKDFLSPINPKVKELYKLDYEWLDSIKDQFVNISETPPVEEE